MIRELIARDKNHPCVVVWCIANEPESDTPRRARTSNRCRRARRLDPTRPVGFANVMLAPAGNDVITDLFDVSCSTATTAGTSTPAIWPPPSAALEAELRAWADKHGKPIIVTEYGADAIAGVHGVVPRPWTEEYQVELLGMYHRVFDRVDAVVGEHVWKFADFATPTGSSGSTATRRVCSPATGGPRRA